MEHINPELLSKYIAISPMCCEKHPDSNLFIYGYHKMPEKAYEYESWDEINSICRGIIINNEGKIIEKCLPKFWTFKKYISNNLILLNDNIVKSVKTPPKALYEKIDGTMCILYWVNGMPALSTQRSFTNAKAFKATKILYEKYQHSFDSFDKNYTYIFEARYPETKILIDYQNSEDLVLLAKIDKKTGRSVTVDNKHFQQPINYIENYRDKASNLEKLRALNIKSLEGFVVLYENDLRIKLKFEHYQTKHKFIDQLLNYKKLAALKHYEINKHTYKIIDQATITKLLNSNKINELRYNTKLLYYLLGFDSWLNHKITKYNPTPFNFFSDLEKEFNIHERVKDLHIYETINWQWNKAF